MPNYSAMPIIDGWVELSAKAESPEEARKIMNRQLEEMDFGPLRDVAWDANGYDITED